MVTMTRKNQHKVQVNIEIQIVDYVIRYGNAEIPSSSRKCVRGIWRDHPPFIVLLAMESKVKTALNSQHRPNSYERYYFSC